MFSIDRLKTIDNYDEYYRNMQMKKLKSHIKEYEDDISFAIYKEQTYCSITPLCHNPIYIQVLIDELKKLGAPIKIDVFDGGSFIHVSGLEKLHRNYHIKVHSMRIECFVEVSKHHNYCPIQHCQNEKGKCEYKSKTITIEITQNDIHIPLTYYKGNQFTFSALDDQICKAIDEIDELGSCIKYKLHKDGIFADYKSEHSYNSVKYISRIIMKSITYLNVDGKIL